MKCELVGSLLVGGLLLTSPIVLLAAPAAGNTPSKSAASTKLSTDATQMLHQVDMASQALSNKDSMKAMMYIGKALAERNQLAIAAKAKGKSLVIPLYSELDESSALGPAISARSGKTQPSLNGPITVDDVSSQYTFVGLDLDKAKSRLDAAKLAVKNHNDQAASDSLGAIGTDLVVDKDNQDLPLLAIRENLGLAQSAVKHSHYAEASSALKQASTELDDYAAKGSSHEAQAKAMRTKIDDLSKTLAEHHSGAEASIEQWWGEVDSWFSKHT